MYWITKYKGIYSLKTDSVIIFVNTIEKEKQEKQSKFSIKDEINKIGENIIVNSFL